jgi:signal transduction histidine kinase
MDEVLWTGRSETLRASPENKVEVAIEEVEEGSDLQVQGNEDLLRSLVVNLLENACKYSPDHRAIVTLSGSAEQVTLEVADQGIGISAEDRKHIFEPFFRATNATVATGHGIGLSLVERIVRLHGATIDLRSAPGEGSVFTVRFPKRN